MTQFILRVSLSNGTEQNYVKLRDALINIGYSKFIVDDLGVKHRLPNGNYLINSNHTISDVHKKTKETVFSLDKNALILLVASKGARFSNI